MQQLLSPGDHERDISKDVANEEAEVDVESVSWMMPLLEVYTSTILF